MTNEEVMKIMFDMGLHDGGMENWIPDNAWVRVVNKAVERMQEEIDELRQALAQHVDNVYMSEERVQKSEKSIHEWQELDADEVTYLIEEHITDPSPELRQELYGLIAEADMLLQEKNHANNT